ncbi:MAG: hypothetical protein ACLUUO_14460 [Sellimonas intestinalis]
MRPCQILSGRASTRARLQHFHTLREQLRAQKSGAFAKQLLAITQETEVGHRTDYEKLRKWRWKTLSSGDSYLSGDDCRI